MPRLGVEFVSADALPDLLGIILILKRAVGTGGESGLEFAVPLTGPSRRARKARSKRQPPRSMLPGGVAHTVVCDAADPESEN